MITIISGVPGTGKTGLVVDMIMEELKQGRKVYTYGIPDLVLNVQQAGDVQEWQDGSWLKIDHYNPKLTAQKGVESSWFPRDCPTTCEWLATCPTKHTKERPDGGSLIVIDEAHIKFPQRASGKAPPPFVEALNVHRHQGLDFWFLTQRPSFLDPFVRGLASRHIHLELSAFSFTGQRNKYQWSEYQETVNRTSKLQAAKTKYKPMPHVFPLYASATVHTKLDQKMPNIMKTFIAVILILLVFVGFAVSRVNNRIEQINEVKNQPQKQIQPAAHSPKPVGASGGALAAPPGAADGLGVQLADNRPAWPFPRVDSCLSTSTYCRCYLDGLRVPMEDLTCKAIIEGGWIKPRETMSLPNRF